NRECEAKPGIGNRESGIGSVVNAAPTNAVIPAQAGNHFAFEERAQIKNELAASRGASSGPASLFVSASLPSQSRLTSSAVESRGNDGVYGLSRTSRVFSRFPIPNSRFPALRA